MHSIAHRLRGVNVIDNWQAAAEGSSHMPEIVAGHFLQTGMPVLFCTLAFAHCSEWLDLQYHKICLVSPCLTAHTSRLDTISRTPESAHVILGCVRLLEAALKLMLLCCK